MRRRGLGLLAIVACASGCAPELRSRTTRTPGHIALGTAAVLGLMTGRSIRNAQRAQDRAELILSSPENTSSPYTYALALSERNAARESALITGAAALGLLGLGTALELRPLDLGGTTIGFGFGAGVFPGLWLPGLAFGIEAGRFLSPKLALTARVSTASIVGDNLHWLAGPSLQRFVGDSGWIAGGAGLAFQNEHGSYLPGISLRGGWTSLGGVSGSIELDVTVGAVPPVLLFLFGFQLGRPR